MMAVLNKNYSVQVSVESDYIQNPNFIFIDIDENKVLRNVLICSMSTNVLLVLKGPIHQTNLLL